MKTQYASILALTLLAACGAADDRDEGSTGTKLGQNKTDETGGTSGAADYDENVASEEASAQMDDAISGALEEDDNSPLALSLTGWDVNVEAKRFRDCKDEGDTAIVEIAKSFQKTREAAGKFRKGSVSYKFLMERTRTWAKAGADVPCAENKKHVQLDLAAMQGVTLGVAYKNERSRSWHVENLKNGKTQDRTMSRVASGTRNIEWTAQSEADGIVTLEKTVTLAGERTLSATGKDGTQKEVTRSVKTGDSAPLLVSVQRKAGTGEFVQRTIKSGTLVATGKEGGRIETTFENVVYVKGKGCAASSGKIAGSIFAEGATEARVTFTVDLDAQNIVFSDGREIEISNDGCELDEPETSEEQATKADMPEHV